MANNYIGKDPNLQLYVDQWHPTKNELLTPMNIKPSSNLDIWWICPNFSDHEWKATPIARIGQSQGCPVCLNRVILKGFNDFSYTQPALMKQWHPTLNILNPEEIAPSANKDAWWICPVGEDHVWKAKINSRVSGGNGCPYCANRKILAGFNDLGSSSYENVIKEWHPEKNEKNISEVGVSSNYKVWWLCDNGHEWTAIIANRTTKGSNCPECRKTKKKLPKGTVDKTELALEWHEDNDRKASEVSTGSNYDALWQCTKDSRHVWNAVVSNRMRGSGCLICSDRKIIVGVNDLASNEEFSYLVEQWHPDNEISPTQVVVGSDLIIKWICSEDHIWKANLYSRSRKGQNCPECTTNRTPWSEEKKTLLDYPELALQLHESNILKAEQIPFRSGKTFLWVCPKSDQHVWNASVVSRSLDGKDCPVCAGRIVIPGINDLASSSFWEKLEKEWSEENTQSPESISISSAYLAKWKCDVKADHEWETVVYARTRTEASGCPRCSLASQTSKGEIELYDILVLMGFDPVQRETRVIKGELDLYIPEKNFGIEYNGVYWHSEAIRPDKNYHAKKLAECQKSEVYLYNVWEDDWRSKKEIIMRGIAHRLGASDKLANVFPDMPDFWTEKIGARKTTVKMIPFEVAKEFLDTHHIQGSATGSFYIGLIDSLNRVRAVIVLARTNKEGELLISRYATAGIVSGGFTKLMKYAENSFDFSTWVTFADLSLSDGNLYDAHGFTVDSILPPDYSYLVKGSRVHKFNYRLKRFRKDPELIFMEGVSEKELADMNKLPRVWDFGKKRYVKDVIRETI